MRTGSAAEVRSNPTFYPGAEQDRLVGDATLIAIDIKRLLEFLMKTVGDTVQLVDRVSRAVVPERDSELHFEGINHSSHRGLRRA